MACIAKASSTLQCSVKSSSTQVASCRPFTAKGRMVVRAKAGFEDKAAPQQGRLDSSGYIRDNSGKGNMYPELSKPYLKSGRAEQVATEGVLGGATGGAVLAGVVGLVAVVAVAALQAPPAETLNQVATSFDGESLSVIAQRLSSSL